MELDFSLLYVEDQLFFVLGHNRGDFDALVLNSFHSKPVFSELILGVVENGFSFDTFLNDLVLFRSSLGKFCLASVVRLHGSFTLLAETVLAGAAHPRVFKHNRVTHAGVINGHAFRQLGGLELNKVVFLETSLLAHAAGVLATPLAHFASDGKFQVLAFSRGFSSSRRCNRGFLGRSSVHVNGAFYTDGTLFVELDAIIFKRSPYGGFANEHLDVFRRVTIDGGNLRDSSTNLSVVTLGHDLHECRVNVCVFVDRVVDHFRDALVQVTPRGHEGFVCLGIVVAHRVYAQVIALVKFRQVDRLGECFGSKDVILAQAFLRLQLTLNKFAIARRGPTAGADGFASGIHHIGFTAIHGELFGEDFVTGDVDVDGEVANVDARHTFHRLHSAVGEVEVDAHTSAALLFVEVNFVVEATALGGLFRVVGNHVLHNDVGVGDGEVFTVLVFKLELQTKILRESTIHQIVHIAGGNTQAHCRRGFAQCAEFVGVVFGQRSEGDRTRNESLFKLVLGNTFVDLTHSVLGKDGLHTRSQGFVEFLLDAGVKKKAHDVRKHTRHVGLLLLGVFIFTSVITTSIATEHKDASNDSV